MIKTLLVFIVLIVSYVAAAGQSVMITPRKTIYRRPKPIQQSKRSFAVLRPIAKAAKATISRKITAAISPEAVLDLNIRDELGKYQWLEETDYNVMFNRDNVLSVKLRMMGAGAYPDEVTRYVVVDARNGSRVKPADVFANLAGLAALAKKAQQAEMNSAVAEMKKDPENADVDPSQLFQVPNFKSTDLKEFSVTAKGVTFYYDYGFPHAIKALQPAGEFFFTWSQMKPFIRMDGLLGRFVS